MNNTAKSNLTATPIQIQGEKKPSKKKLIIVLVALLVLCILIIIAVLILSSLNKQKPKQEDTNPVVSTPVDSQGSTSDDDLNNLLKITPIYFSSNSKTYKVTSMKESPEKIADAAGDISPDRNTIIYTKPLNADFVSDGIIYEYNIPFKQEKELIDYKSELKGTPKYSPEGDYVSIVLSTSPIGSLNVFSTRTKELLFEDSLIGGKYDWRNSDEIIYAEAINGLVGRPFDAGAFGGGVTLYNLINKKKEQLILPTATKEYGYGGLPPFNMYRLSNLLTLLESSYTINNDSEALEYTDTTYSNKTLNIDTLELFDENPDPLMKELQEKVSEVHPDYVITNLQVNKVNSNWVLFDIESQNNDDGKDQKTYSYIVNLSNIDDTIKKIEFSVAEGKITNGFVF